MFRDSVWAHGTHTHTCTRTHTCIRMHTAHTTHTHTHTHTQHTHAHTTRTHAHTHTVCENWSHSCFPLASQMLTDRVYRPRPDPHHFRSPATIHRQVSCFDHPHMTSHDVCPAYLSPHRPTGVYPNVWQPSAMQRPSTLLPPLASSSKT